MLRWQTRTNNDFMAEIIGSIWWLLVVLGLLVTFHEFGHYWVARRCGVRVLRFSVGFGKPLWMRTDKNGTEWAVAAIPLGGYVKMLDEREGEVPENQMHEAFNRKSVWQRIAIVAAGPIFNLVFAVAAFWVMFMVGIPDVRPLVGEVTGLAAEAEVENGDMIIAVDGQNTETWTHARLNLITRALDRQDVVLTLENRFGNRIDRRVELSRLGDNFNEENALADIGLNPWRPVRPAVIDTVAPDSPAAAAGLRSGDKILSINGDEVRDWAYLGALINRHGGDGQELTVSIRRGEGEYDVQITPAKQRQGLFGSRLVLGITNPPLSAEQRADFERAFVQMRFGPVESLGRGVRETWNLASASLGLLYRMITGKASVRNLSGPITIAQVANDSAQLGFTQFLFFLGLISLSLGILNLLPVPVLDGGHLLYYAIELVKGSPVSEQVQLTGQYIGLLALAGLMSLAFVNDILRLFG